MMISLTHSDYHYSSIRWGNKRCQLISKDIGEVSRKLPNDTPIAISEEYTKPDTIEYVCNYCHCKLIKMSEEEYYCNRCSISRYPDVEDVRSKSKITTPIGINLEPVYHISLILILLLNILST